MLGSCKLPKRKFSSPLKTELLTPICLSFSLIHRYDVVVFPNGVFSSTIIASIVHEKGPALIKKTAEYNLLLGTLALPGVFAGALLVNRLGRRNTMMLGFTGYLIFGLSVGLAYDTVILNVPLFVVLYGLMQSSGNLGPGKYSLAFGYQLVCYAYHRTGSLPFFISSRIGDCLGLISSESYATPVRGTLYGLSAAIGKVNQFSTYSYHLLELILSFFFPSLFFSFFLYFSFLFVSGRSCCWCTNFHSHSY